MQPHPKKKRSSKESVSLDQTKKRSKKIRQILKVLYPHVKTQLRHENPFQLLIATILSAQCTDRQVNSVTPGLFRRFSKPEDFVAAPISEIETMIHSTGFFRNKARNVKNCCVKLLENFEGNVPNKLEDLVSLPGVGRKTANVVLGAAFGIPGIVVDTHVSRISQRLGFTKSKNPVTIEFDLMKVIPKNDWNDFGLRLIYFGREICTARKPSCPSCGLRDYCEFPGKTG